jgi:hypothetical protein
MAVKRDMVGWWMVFLVLANAPSLSLQAAQEKARAWPPEIEKALTRAGVNRGEMVKALETAPSEQRKAMAFLIANMPDQDLRSLRADFLLENVRLTYQARGQVAWGNRIPEDLFLNHVLPYASVDEERHPWRKELYELCLPLVKECKTPAEAAQRLNSTVFKKLNVRYSTQRLKPQQSPKESIAGGTASCTGLSILLIDACRSVGVPARLVGTLWANKRGNHTWVEVWDNGWHFTGACEPDARGLDHAWFEGDAAQAQKDSLVHAIYAASFKKTEVPFPLVWAPDRKDVFAENVTDRYARPDATKAGVTRVHIRVQDAERKQRLERQVTVMDREDRSRVWRGESRGEGADTNDLLTFELPTGRRYLLQVERPIRVEKQFDTADRQQIVEVEVSAAAAEPAGKAALSEGQAKQITQAVQEFFAASPDRRASWKFDPSLDALLRGDEAAVRRAVWKAYQAAPIHADQKRDFEQHQIRFEKHLSPYAIRKVGKRPANGWPLFIALHGGGGAPKELNDSQWRDMQRYYRDQADVTGYQYLALRAPNDTWNGFYDNYVPPLVINLIRQQLLFGDVDADKVYVMGYSHGGYGAFFVGPKIPDRFAAIHSSAAAPTDGTISPKALRNTPFSFMVGEFDNAYGRRKRCEAFDEAIRKLKEQDPDGYPVKMELKNGFGHGGLPDRDKIKDLYPFTRSVAPRQLSWELTDPVIHHFFWLSVREPAKGQVIEATVRDNTVRITTRNIKLFDVCLDSRLIDFSRPVSVVLDGKTRTLEARPQLLTLCQSMLERGDPELAFTYRIPLGSK